MLLGLRFRMRIVIRTLTALGITIAIAAIVFFASRGHVLFFPFVLILGAPLWWLLRPPQNRP
jgi:hypothetical protein